MAKVIHVRDSLCDGTEIQYHGKGTSRRVLDGSSWTLFRWEHQYSGFGEQIETSRSTTSVTVSIGTWVYENFYGTYGNVLEGLGKKFQPGGRLQIGNFDTSWSEFGLKGVAYSEESDGSNYSGEFKESKKHGFGTETFSAGKVLGGAVIFNGYFIGSFSKDKRHGPGLLVRPDYSKVAVEYANGNVVSETLGLLPLSILCWR
jgi:hypothetical protein